MILDDHQHDPDDVDDLGDLDDSDDSGEWLGGLERAGLPVVSRSAPPQPQTLSTAVEELIAGSWAPAAASDDVRALVEASLAPTTRAAYEADWLEFATWARVHGLDDPLEATEVDVAEYVAAMVRARLAMATVRRRLAGIAFAFALLRRESPTRDPLVRRTVLGAARTLGTAQDRAAPLRLDAMRSIVRAMPIVQHRRRPDLMRRDQLLVALGWAGALRAGELVGLDAEDLHFVGDPNTGDGGVLLRIRRSKTDRAAQIEWVAVPYASQWTGCPVRLALTWRKRHRTGPLFRHVDRHGRTHGRLSPAAVSRLLPPLVAEMLDTDPAPYSSHSLRAGFVTEARAHGVPDERIARHTRHSRPGARRADMLAVYDRPTNLFERPALDPGWW